LYSIETLQQILQNEFHSRMNDLKLMRPEGLYSPVDYSLEMGGKRIRPLLLLIGYQLFSDDLSNALPAAIAIEMFHNFTLLHDDIMDKASVRRNQPTVHTKYGENSAILSGDVMAFVSYRYLLESKTEKLREVMELFTSTAIEVCEGQQLDMEFENRVDVTEAEYLEMIRLKTAVLLGCSLKAGALLANADEKMADDLYEYGINLGLAFQLQDDLLDSFGIQETFGKKIGGDILANKKTYLLIYALKNAKGNFMNELQSWLNAKDFNTDEKISAVLNIYSQLNVKKLAQQKIDFYFGRCTSILNKIIIDDSRKSILKEIGESMMLREK